MRFAFAVRFAMTAVTGSVVRRLPPRADGGAVAEIVLRLAVDAVSVAEELFLL